MKNAEFNDPRLVEVYDAECPWSRDDDFFASFADELGSARVLDYGCGTGRLALGLVARGHAVVGIDPAEESIRAAKQKPGADQVTWMTGYAGALPDESFDLVLMTSHVAQFITEDDAWLKALSNLRRTLVPGGRLIFDTRDPADRRWERWNPIASQRQVTLAGGRVVRAWTEVVAADAGLVTFTHHYNFDEQSAELASESTLRFRSLDEVTASLTQAGLTLIDVYGGFGREPVGAEDGEFLVVATREA
jgi:SAM-dependent methyltransferase